MNTPLRPVLGALLAALALSAFTACGDQDIATPTPQAVPFVSDLFCTDTPYYLDNDGDGYGDQLRYSLDCSAPQGAVALPGDCDDADPSVHPGAPGQRDDRDTNCDGVVDEGEAVVVPGPNARFQDFDHDGHGDPNVFVQSGAPYGNGWVALGDDCDDRDPFAHPGREEVCDGVDNDCDGAADEGSHHIYVDADEDGYGYAIAFPERMTTCRTPMSPQESLLGGDCDDHDPAQAPGRAEVCNGEDDDCDQHIDEELWSTPLFEDRDGDGHGGASVSVGSACEVDVAYVDQGGDCDDRDPSSYPGAIDGCDAKDNDCDRKIDEGSGALGSYRDEDGDGFGGSPAAAAACAALPGWVEEGGDCDDHNPATYPGAPELCTSAGRDAIDSDCDGDLTDEPEDNIFRDFDRDGFGSTYRIGSGCTLGEGQSFSNTDCDDEDVSAYPGALERCDGRDNDCDGVIDQDPKTLYYTDDDGDGFPGGSYVSVACGQPFEGAYPYSSDCDDDDPTVHPFAADPFDGIDQDCGGWDGPQPTVGQGPNQVLTLQEAVDWIPTGGTVWIAPGHFAMNAFSFGKKSVTLAGAYGRESVRFSGQGTGPIFADVEEGQVLGLQDLTLEEGYQYSGGALAVEGGTLNARRVAFLGNDALREGGALATTSGEVNLYDCLFEENHSQGQGGAIALRGAEVYMSSCTLRDNTAETYGGAVALVNGSLTLNYSALVRNDAPWGGGAIHSGGHLYLYDNDLTENTTQGDGGAILASAGDAILRSNHLKGNVAEGLGGGLAGEGQLESTYNQYRDNHAGAGGGGVAVWRGELSMMGGGLSRNTTEGEGGGLWLADTEAHLFRFDMQDNLSERSGGGLYCARSEVLAEDVGFDANVTHREGGGAYVGEGCSLTAYDIELNRNRADAGIGGGLMVRTGALARLTRLSAMGNGALSGGGLGIGPVAQLVVSNGLLYGNVATTGPAVMNMGDLDLSHGAVLTGGTEPGGEGVSALTQLQGSARIRNSIFSDNGDEVPANVGIYAGTLESEGNLYWTPGGGSGVRGAELGASDRVSAPIFLYGTGAAGPYANLPPTLTLALDSPGIDAGVCGDTPTPVGVEGAGDGDEDETPGCWDIDRSPPDIGIYGGLEGGMWDYDRDGRLAYPWPGTFEDAPPGMDPVGFDRDDRNSQI